MEHTETRILVYTPASTVEESGLDMTTESK